MSNYWHDKTDKIEKLTRKLNYAFSDIKLLRAAITHRSTGETNNERLEFLGDSVLNFVIAAELYNRFPKAKEGDLTRLRAHLVRGETVAEIARDLGIGEYLSLGIGEQKSGGYKRESILSDAMEAIIGAIYLDSNLDSCRTRILTWYDSRLNALIPGASEKDAKTQLQEYCQARHCPLPEYHVLEISGDPHEPTFRVECRVSLLKIFTIGVANSRRKAEQNAADAALEKLQYER
jgi:ribonuclease-3